jgi:2-polyprenyl-3-methyl-5-hydroxy-6-metoxy-1,4-benzoquinol methylase
MTLGTHAAACPICAQAPEESHASGPDFEYDTTPGVEWSYLRCSRCDVIMISPCPDEAALGTLYPPNYYAYDFSTKKSLGFRVKELLDRRSVRAYLDVALPGRPILDVGCGDGRLLRMFASQGMEPAQLHGMELDPRAVERARAQGLNVKLGRFEDLDYAPRSFGLVVMQQVIEHVIDPRDVLARVHEVLAPGGAVVLETPNTASWDHGLFSRRYWGGYHIPRHLFLFNPKSLSRLLDETGFRVERVRHLASPSFWIQSVHHLLADRGAPSGLVDFFGTQPSNPVTLAAFSALDGFGKLFGITSNMRVIGVRQ